MKRNNILGFLFASILFIACSTSDHKNRELEDPSATETTAEVAATVSQSMNIPMTDYDGMEHLFHFENDTTYVINFWATWCKPCVEELPYFEQLWDEYREEKFKVILISLDFPQQIEKKLKPFILKHQLESEVWILNDSDANTWINKVSPQWSGAIPATIVYNRNAREFREQSFETFEELNELVKPLITTN